ncbi:VWA domain-containing protein [Metabacillus halosaccharovorans]|uniref:VWA domain-containing protein n=1 Tax=Metabacillus halosaccharovorans TaxID=930124 RepID=UPI001C1FCA0E|nr:VWA domain-containing protein [Metabacillus halosaccharovorans]MBU7595245.1 VWA domain-containing protein [Metabacillus halosaccharovorans]
MRNKNVFMMIICCFMILVGCSDKVSKDNGTNITTEEEEVREETDTQTKKKEAVPEIDSSSVWPDAFETDTDAAFQFPTTLSEAEEWEKGKWWSKLKLEQITDSDNQAVDKELLTIIDSNLSDEQKGYQIKQFLAETYFPDLPGFSTFLPRGKISLEELDATSNIQLNGREMKDHINVAIILDASGSMKKVIGGKTLMDIAKESIQEFTTNLPENANVSLTVYGHKGTSSDQDKELSCKGIEEIYSLSKYDAESFQKAIQSISPSGWTSIAESLKQTGSKLNNNDATNVIYLVSDGEETCDGKPKEEAQALAQSDINAIINVIGLSVTSEDAAQLKEIAESAEGRYIDVKNQQELDQEFQQSNNTISQWVDWFHQNNNKAIDLLSEDKKRLMDLNEETVENLMLFHQTSVKTLMNANESGKLDPAIYQDVFGALESFYSTMYQQKDEIYNEKFKQIEDSFNLTKEEIEEKYNNRQ